MTKLIRSMQTISAMALAAILLFVGVSNAEEPLVTPTDEKSDVDLTIRISNIKHTSGELAIVVYGVAANFPDKSENADYKFRIKPTKPEVVIKSIPPGEYAVVISHDVNGNKIVDKSFIGIPTEPVGISNYETIGILNRPTYEKAKVSVTRSKTIVVKLNSI